MIYLIAGIVAFLGIHCVRMVVPDFREGQIAKLGIMPWKGIYSVISILSLVLIIWGYGQARQDNVYFYYPPAWLSHVQLLLMIPAMILAIVGDLPVGRIKKAVKNPLLIAVKVWAFGHLLVNGDLASILLFGSFLIWAIILLINTKRRGQTFPETTNTKSDVIAVVGGLVLWLAIAFWLHEWLIGVPVIA